jgi:hypothetical protein
MDKLKAAGQNLGWVFHSGLSRACIGRAIVHITIQPNFKLKTLPKQLLGFLPLAFVLPAVTFKRFKIWNLSHFYLTPFWQLQKVLERMKKIFLNLQQAKKVFMEFLYIFSYLSLATEITLSITAIIITTLSIRGESRYSA